MRKIKEIARLRLGMGRSIRETAESAGVAKTTVIDCLHRLERAGLGWPLPCKLDDSAIELALYPPKHDSSSLAVPDWSYVHQELRRPGVTRQLIWHEHLDKFPEGLSYSRFCDLYVGWLKSSRISMRQIHKGGEKLFVDFAGTTIPVFDPRTGEARQAQVFVATWGASNYTFATAVWDQKLPTWLWCHSEAFEFFGCLPTIVVPDNLKSGVTTPCRYDPEVNATYQEFAQHYGVAVIPARSGKPKDKAKVEFSVRLSTRWIIAVLRNRKFFSLEELNRAILECLVVMNGKAFQKMPGSRKSAFETFDRPNSQALPEKRYEFADVLLAKPNIDYHIAVDDHFYSVPYQLRAETLTVRLTSHTLEIMHKNRRIFTHVRSYQKWGFTTVTGHMPKSHQAHAEWTPTRIIEWAGKSGAHTAALVSKMIEERDHPAQGYRASLGVIRLGQKYGNDRLNNACRRALLFNTHRFRFVRSILERGLDREFLPEVVSAPIAHEHIRGSEYYSTIEEESAHADPSNCFETSGT